MPFEEQEILKKQYSLHRLHSLHEKMEGIVPEKHNWSILPHLKHRPFQHSKK